MGLISRLVFVGLSALSGVAAAAEAPGLLVPAYFSPVSDSTDWARLTAAASKVSITAIINPDSGPGRAYDATYAKAIADFHAAGGRVLGYVDTNYGRRGLAEAKSDVSQYLSWYSVDGFFFDQAASEQSALHVDYYTRLTSFTRGQSASPLHLIANPGTPPDGAYAPLFDSLVMYEDTAAKLPAYQSPTYVANYPAIHFNMLVLDAASPSMSSVIAGAAGNKLGMVFVTDRSLKSNPWATLPSYWDAEVAAMQAVSSVPEPGQLPMLGAGLLLMAGLLRRR